MKFLSITEVASELKKSRQWIWKLIKQEKIYAEKAGTQFIIGEEELQRYKTTKTINTNKELN